MEIRRKEGGDKEKRRRRYGEKKEEKRGWRKKRIGRGKGVKGVGEKMKMGNMVSKSA